MTDAPVPPLSVSLDGFSEGSDQQIAGGLSYMIEQQALLQVLVTGITELLPDPSLWRLTISGDMVPTVNRIAQRGADDPYTIERGAGQAGAITLPRADGTFDIVITAHALFAIAEEVASIEELVAHVLASAKHLSRHEAGHAVLRLRGENADAYKDVGGLDKSAAASRSALAAHVDDNRIEQYTAAHSPAPLQQVGHLADAVAHLQAALNAASRTWRDDIRGAAVQTLNAANDLAHVFAYLAPELGIDEDGKPCRPDPLPVGWDVYIEESWDAWSLTFHRLRPVDEVMTADEIGAVLADLCRLMNAWLQSIGVDYGISDDNHEYIFWTKASY